MNRWHIVSGMVGLFLCHTSLLEASEILPVHAMTAEPLGRLFHSPQARAGLDEARRSHASPRRQALAGRISIDGIVRRGKGPTTVWINGQIMEEGVLITQAGTSSVRLDSGDGQVHDLKVGESIEFTPTRHSP